MELEVALCEIPFVCRRAARLELSPLQSFSLPRSERKARRENAVPGDPARNTLLLSRLPGTCASSPCRSAELREENPGDGDIVFINTSVTFIFLWLTLR